MQKRIILGALIVLLSVSMVFAGGQKDSAEGAPTGEKVELNLFFYKDTIVDGMNALAEAFMAENPGVVINNEMLTTEFNTVLM
nr:hypothetical protein [Spirochaetales bacterium]